MSKLFRKAVIYIIAFKMIAQSFSVPLNMAFAETLTDFDDVSETNEFPSIVEQTEADELKDETFHFSDTYLKGKVSEPIIVKIFSNSEYLSVPITLPEEAQIVEEKLPEGISIKQEAQLGRWLIESVRPQDTFDIPLFFEVPGKYQVSVLEKILVLEIEEEQPTNEARDTESEENKGIFPDEDGIAGQESVETGIDYEAYSEHLELFNEVFEGTPLNENRKVIVDVNNLQDYFHFIGNAKNDGFGQVTLTEEVTNQAGAITLKEKMLSGYPMRVTGSINTGRLSNTGLGSSRGGDGVGFGFHADDLDAVGETGQGMGLAGLASSFGFKIDTYRNSSATALTEADPSSIDGTSNSAFGAFVYTDSNSGILRNYQGNEAPPRVTTNPSNNSFRNFSLVYNPGVDNKILSISYEGRVWRVDVSQWIDTEDLSFIISAATGGSVNLHQIRLDRFEYVAAATEYDFIEGDRTNFLDHFHLSGSAIYNDQTGIVTLTEDRSNQNGSILLKEKLSNIHPFEFKGRVNIGNGNGGQGASGSSLSGSDGGDGIGFGFHQSELDTLGQSGQGMGIAGLQNAWGFKLDTYHNRVDSGSATADLDEFRSTGVWPLVTHNPHGSFIYTRDDGMLTSHVSNNNDSSAAKAILRNNNNLFREFKMTYNPGEYDSILSIEYNGQVWHHDVSEWLSSGNVTALSFIISAATGAQSNLQQIEVDYFKYIVGEGSVNVEYKDIDTQENILSGESFTGKLGDSTFIDPKSKESDEPFLNGYDFVGISEDSSSLIDDKGYYTFSDEEKTIVYYFTRAKNEVKVMHVAEPGTIVFKEETVEIPVNQHKEFSAEYFEGYELLYIQNDEEILEDVQSLTLKIQRDSPKWIRFVYIKENDRVSPLDPLAPDKEVNPENPPSLPENQGLFSIDFASNFYFGSFAISAQDKRYYAKPQRLLSVDGMFIEEEIRPNYVQVSDRRPSNTRGGWELSVSQNEQFYSAETGSELTGASFIFQNQQLVSVQDGIEPGLQQTTPITLIPGGAKRTVLKAQGAEGTGTWIYRFGDFESAGRSVILEVPKGANPDAASYKTTLTWELSSVPSN
ncbi:putative secreted protein [Enterococcus sp. C1]|uniref:lectin-like domain-containing protein n=1 Tax=unclassified Enterococcus TaxID=2608891 RepID=UPI000271E639|nr:WxL domain-containing protein [Enterococcus sp. C1]EJF50727.1 putative secreted protein [Enterococcus sp. C1]